jgi:ethanolamine utilization protein EutM
MAQQAIGMIETRGLVALVEATDAMLKAANVELVGPITQVGSALVTVVVTGDVAAVKAATEAGRAAAETLGDIVSVSVIARPHGDVAAVLPEDKKSTSTKRGSSSS